ncbi:hypothetical protein BUALT_Bualt02G0097500 [Buddleja alternifolia]|uniref:Uncharacterized protein n=1 Tax=Buddleja alternifolia TaxID=168488 RepID=A0AAV6Y9R0_9LAMI|nr:hypothetical protein BUALT_Bualt02G0097500 [Buddleja alternifolia]
MSGRILRRSHAAPSPSLEAVKFKLWRIVSRHEQLKVAFHQLNSQIRTGLLEAEDVFASLAIPLTKLVGLKTVEMATEGRFSTIVTSADRSHSQFLICILVDVAALKSMQLYADVVLLRFYAYLFSCNEGHATPDENYMNRAMTVGNELMERQKLQLIQLINLLKKIEAQVNSSQNSIFQSLADHQASIKKFFLKAATYVSAIHQSNQNNELSHMMLKLLKATFDEVGVALNSVEVGIDDLISELAAKMCNPMVQYVNGLKVEMKTGTCSRLLEVVKEMDGAMKVRKFELEEERKRATLAEQSRIEALSKLKASEETARKMTKSLGLLIEDTPTTEPEENLTQQKSLSLKEDKAKDDNLLWELLRKKRKCQVPDSPVGPNELLGIGTYNKKLSLTRASPALNHRPVTRSRSKGLDLKSSSINSRLLLGASPSATTQKVLCRKRITP